LDKPACAIQVPNVGKKLSRAVVTDGFAAQQEVSDDGF
jgi:hypothetical protein